MNKKSTKKAFRETTSENLEDRFDKGEDVLDYFDTENIQRPGWVGQKVNVDFPKWMVHLLDKESKRLGVARQALIKIWISERLENIHHTL